MSQHWRTTSLKHIMEEVGSKTKAAEFTVVMDENGPNIDREIDLESGHESEELVRGEGE